MAHRDRNPPERKLPTDAPGRPPSPAESGAKTDVAAFLEQVRTMPKPAVGPMGRLVFALDATASRQPTWDRACHIQAEMFGAVAGLGGPGIGGLSVQLLFCRGFGECKASPWVTNAQELQRRMTSVTCLGGQTQIAKVLSHAVRETGKAKVNAVVFVGDACEEDPDRLCHLAGELGLLGVPVFVFHEGGDPVARRVFEQIAKLSKGAYCPFDAGSAGQLAELLKAVAVYAAGGRAALLGWSRGRSGDVLRLTHQVAGQGTGHGTGQGTGGAGRA